MLSITRVASNANVTITLEVENLSSIALAASA